MNTIFNKIGNDWTNIKNKCRTTVNKEYTDKPVDSDFKYNLLISEHSPIRLLEVDWSWKKIKYWVSTEWSRHKFEKFISTQRTDRTGVNRNELPQSALVNFDGYANAQNLIDAWRKRLCYSATKEARELAEDFKLELLEKEQELSDVLVPNCVYRCGCPEFRSCTFWKKFKEEAIQHDVDLTEIKSRYEWYNLMFCYDKVKQ